MAKDLPYFKFFCSEWNDGDITLESFEHQGLFINICSYYWSNECYIHLDKLLKRFRGYNDIIDDLISANLFKVNQDRTISITFLDEQRDERLEQSKIKSKGGKASAEARRLKKLEAENKHLLNSNSTENEHVLNSCSTESQVLREEEKRREKKRKDNIIEDEFDTEKNLDIDILKNHYLKSTKILNAVIGNKINNLIDENDLKVKLDKFHNSLIETGSLKKSFSEYAIYFRNWCKTKQFEKLKPKKQEPIIPSRGFSL